MHRLRSLYLRLRRPYGGNIPRGMELGLQETAFFDPRRSLGLGRAFGDDQNRSGNGDADLEKLVLILNGQIHGDVAQGLGEALRDQMLFGDNGEVLTGSLMNCAVPRAGDMPQLTLEETVTPNPFNPLGVKGVGEAGCNGAPPAVANAVMDALAPLGIDHIDMHYTAPKL
jgi:carbon-monoxide dehydrogenase large subunit